MKPLAITLEGYGPFVDRTTLTLGDGVTVIAGPNGAGKTTILNAIDVALFGPRRGRSLDDLYATGGNDRLTVAVEFEHDHTVYRVIRVGERGRTPALYFERRDGDGWEPLNRENKKNTQEMINATLRLSRETFQASAFAGQGEGAAFADANPKARKEIMLQAIGVSVYDTVAERARREAKSAETELVKVAALLEQAQAELDAHADIDSDRDTIQAEVDEAAAALANAEQEFERLRDLSASVEARRSAYAAAAADERATREALERLERDKQAGVEAATAIEAIRAEITALECVAFSRTDRVDALATLREQRDQARTANAELGQLHAQVAQIRERAELLRDDWHKELDAAADLETRAEDITDGAGVDRCDRCQQILHGDARETAANSLRREAADHRARAANLTQELAKLSGEEDDLVLAADAIRIPDEPDADTLAAAELAVEESRVAAARAAVLAERTANLARQADIARSDEFRMRLVAAREAFEIATRNLRALGDPPRDEEIEGILVLFAGMRRRAAEARESLDNARAHLARADATLERLATVQAQAETLTARRETIARDKAVLDDVERAFGRDGIPLLILENVAVPQIEAEAAGVLDAFGYPFRVELRTQRELKTGGASDALDIMIVTPDGERPFETFSGGERTCISLALRVGLARLLRNRRGASVDMLALDEPDALDEDRYSRLAEILHGLEHEFSRVLIVSHHPALRDAFENVVTVAKDDNGNSRIDAPMLEVAA